jgi:hypothetical protein
MIVVFAFLHYLVAGCYKTTAVQQEELSAETTQCCVHEVILTTGEYYEFKRPGGQYNVISGLITGTLNDGRKFFLDLTDENIKEIRIPAGQIISRVDFAKNPDQKISKITVGENIYIFDQNGGSLQTDVETIHGKTISGDEIDVPIEDILHVKVERLDPGRTVAGVGGGVIGVIVVAFGLLILVFAVASCPLIYSYDGEQYVFDAEPLGGAVSKGLQKNDYSRLDHLKAVDKSYKLMFRNELKETQYLDEIKLLVFDHNPGDIIIPDPTGHFYKISSPVVSSKATDELGQNLDLFLNQNDGVAWQTYLPKIDGPMINFQRHQIILEFPRPAGVKRANLVVNAGTALWGSNMMHEMLQLRGDRVDDWYRAIDTQGPELWELYHFMDREQLYILKIQLKDGDQWVEQGYIPGGGPLVTEDRVIPLDLSEISGDKLVLRLEPPPGFWQIDYIAMDYGPTKQLVGYEIPLKAAVDNTGKEITPSLNQVDGFYHQMPEVNDWFKAEFAAPERNSGMQRSIFLKTTGYYEIRLDKSQPEQTELIQTLIATPRKIVDYSNQRYSDWFNEQFSAN